MTNRRAFLKSASALALAPWAQSFANNLREERPMRFVFFLQGNGIYPDQIQPTGIELTEKPSKLVDRPLGALPLSSSIVPLEPFRKRMTIIQGLSGRVVGPPPHSADFGALGCFPQRKQIFGETIDGALAKIHPGIFPHLGLGITDWTDTNVIYNVSAWERNKALPTQCNPLLAYERLFAGTTTGDSRKAFDAKTNILDFVSEDVRRLHKQLNSTEKAKLGYYLDALESMSERQHKLLQAGSTLTTTQTNAQPVDLPEGIGGFAHLDAQFEIAANALIAGLTKVVTVSSSSGLGFQEMKVDGSELGFAPGPINLHSMAHGTEFCGRTSRELHTAIQHRHAISLARFLEKLNAAPDGEGSMLDNTVIIYLSDQADGHHPSCFEWPIVMIGDLGGRLKSGDRYIRYPWYKNEGHRTTASFFTTLLHAAGTPRDHFGLMDTALADFDQEGPLSELLT